MNRWNVLVFPRLGDSSSSDPQQVLQPPPANGAANETGALGYQNTKSSVQCGTNVKSIQGMSRSNSPICIGVSSAHEVLLLLSLHKHWRAVEKTTQSNTVAKLRSTQLGHVPNTEQGQTITTATLALKQYNKRYGSITIYHS